MCSHDVWSADRQTTDVILDVVSLLLFKNYNLRYLRNGKISNKNLIKIAWNFVQLQVVLYIETNKLLYTCMLYVLLHFNHTLSVFSVYHNCVLLDWDSGRAGERVGGWGKKTWLPNHITMKAKEQKLYFVTCILTNLNALLACRDVSTLTYGNVGIQPQDLIPKGCHI